MRGGTSFHRKHLEVTVSVNICSTKSHVFNWWHLTPERTTWNCGSFPLLFIYLFFGLREKIETSSPFPSASIINSDASKTSKTCFLICPFLCSGARRGDLRATSILRFHEKWMRTWRRLWLRWQEWAKMSNSLHRGGKNALNVILAVVTRLSKNCIIDLRQLLLKKKKKRTKWFAS